MQQILLVDDDLFFQKLYRSKLTQAGFQVSVASDGEEALSQIEKLVPSLILLDMIMPKKDGFEVLEKLSLDPNLKKIPVIILSALEQASDVEKAKKLGAIDYFNKSDLNFSLLIDKIIKYTTNHNT